MAQKMPLYHTIQHLKRLLPTVVINVSHSFRHLLVPDEEDLIRNRKNDRKKTP